MQSATSEIPFCSCEQAWRHGTALLAEAGIERPAFEARLLLAHVLGISQEALLRDREMPAPRADYDAALARRAAREPLALITGRREFWSLSFAVSPATLIPRPDSETLLEAALALFPARERVGLVLDLGVGTGCLLLSALVEFPGAFGVGVDCAPEAARLARRNAVALGLAGRAAFIVGDWGHALQARFDLVLCNPPYIPSSDIPGLAPEVARHEPAGALDGGVDGLEAYRRIIPGLPSLLSVDGAAVVELGAGQARQVAAIAAQVGLTGVGCADLAGLDRAIVLRMPHP